MTVITPLLWIISVAIALIIGFLVGWMLEWRMDLAYWRSYFEDEKEAIEVNPVMVLPAAAPPPQLPSPEDSLLIQTLRQQLTQRETDLADLRSDLTERERAWHDQEVAQRTAAERQVLAVLEKLNASEAHWREAAAAREAELNEDIRRLRAQLDDLQAAKADTDSEWRLELTRREQQWQESKQTEVGALESENQRLREQLEKTEKRLARYRATHPDSFQTIPGIGLKIETDLRQANIHTFADLAAQSPADLQRLLNPPQWRKLDYEGWIAQARQLAADAG